MKNPFKIKQGGVLGRNLKRARNIKIAALSLMLVVFTFGAISVATSEPIKVEQAQAQKAVLPGALALLVAAKFLVKGEFKELTGEDLETFQKEASIEELGSYYKALSDYKNAELVKALESKADKSEIEKLRREISESSYEQLKAELINIQGQFKAFKENGKPLHGESAKAQVYKFIEENKDQIADLYKKKTGVINLTLKAVDTITTANATNPDGIPELVGVQSAPPSNVNLRTTILNGLVSVFPTSLAAYPYTESLPKDGNFAFVGEGEEKSQLDFKTETRYAEPKKVAGWMELSKEAVNDIPGLQAIAWDFLRKKHDLKKQNGILFGDGIGDNLKGATKYGRVFSADGLAGTVIAPNFMDVVNACITDIYTTHNFTDEMPYMANLVLVNPNDFFINLVSAKDGFGHPLYPTASLFNRVVIGGVVIIPFEDIPTGKIFVADMSKYNTTDFEGYNVQIGWINDNMIHNLFVILGESRLHGFVKKLDEQAFIYDDIATIKDAITTV